MAQAAGEARAVRGFAQKRAFPRAAVRTILLRRKTPAAGQNALPQGLLFQEGAKKRGGKAGLSRVAARAENGCAHAHKGGPLQNGAFKICAHAHGQAIYITLIIRHFCSYVNKKLLHF